jgi:diguanylate cyclase (GGDEF)-like protein
MHRVTDQRRSRGIQSATRRDRIARNSDLRRTLRIGSLLVAAILLVTGITLAARFSERAVAMLLLWTSGAAINFVLFLVSSRVPRRFVVPLTVLFTLIPATALMFTATEPQALLSMASGFTMLPVAVPLFLAWTGRLRTSWLLGYAVVFGGVTLVTGFGHLGIAQRLDLATNVVIGSFIGWVGGHLLERLRTRTLEQEIELRRLNKELLIRATTDALTGLANRRQLETDLQVLSAVQPTGGGPCSFIMLDLDQFKQLNDELGHAAGDAALQAVAAVFLRLVRGRDMVYRYGGEEFLVIMPDTSLEAAAAAAERIRVAIAELKIRANKAPSGTTLTISGGVAFALDAHEPWAVLLAAADSALYEAKAGGRNRVRVAPAVISISRPRFPHDRRKPPPRRPMNGPKAPLRKPTPR